MTSVRLRPHSWRRVLLKLGVFLLLGAIINVAVAWGSVILIDLGSDLGKESARSSNAGTWSVEILRKPISYRLLWERTRYESTEGSSEPFPPWDEYLDETNPPPQDMIPAWVSHSPRFSEKLKSELLIFDARGWPTLALGSKAYHVVQELDKTHHWLPIESGICVKEGGVSAIKVLPLRPLWPGFAINTTFYAALLWLLIFAPRNIRRLIRVRKGQCPACAYPVGTSLVCTECGHLLRTHSADTAQHS